MKRRTLNLRASSFARPDGPVDFETDAREIRAELLRLRLAEACRLRERREEVHAVNMARAVRPRVVRPVGRFRRIARGVVVGFLLFVVLVFVLTF
jgi:hypothetical protein